LADDREAIVERFQSTARRRRRCVDNARKTFCMSERRAWRTLGQHRSTRRKAPRGRFDEALLTADIIALASDCDCRRNDRSMFTGLLDNVGCLTVTATRMPRGP
jgi:hypothetical protein